MSHKVAVIIPCYKVRTFVLDVIKKIGPDVDFIVVVDDKCPDNSGEFIVKECSDQRLTVVFHEINKGVGGAVMSGYNTALKLGATILVKIDGDGQMDPSIMSSIIAPIVSGQADYTKGNRFHSFYSVSKMPKLLIFGNASLSFLTKFSSGYWSVFDPTNGYIAIHKAALIKLELKNISERYFFESDMLIKLGDVRALVVDVPMEAVYGEEESNLKISNIFFQFFIGNIKATLRRIIYSYYMRDFNIASVELFFGIVFTLFGLIYGSIEWSLSIINDEVASTGTVMIATLPIILGFQMLLAFLNYDVGNEPKIPLQKLTVKDE
ncbi:glycosyl transferase family 2 [Colwellia sp. MT41]|uniref:glycosyltransferase family 2 protein n=1 Tax=Colwellia sp. MT41 TaxID=58049 RepID=UPI000717AF40|nr:glycosyltransferase family 2 protein [Colwellia sp. MT41]ALO36434.1 glycosyl transferase family 2 [Colwellia sp. MT41]